MKKYAVIVTPEAEQSIIQAYRYIHADSATHAARWLMGIYRCISKLETFPNRCASAREAKYFEEDLRQLVFKSHRIVFCIEQENMIVHVLYLVHGKKRGIVPPEKLEPQ